ncbi:MAG: 30S ribosomal protein S8 [Candidatus Woesearchaeota archaeon]
MSMNDTLAAALSALLNSDRLGKEKCNLAPASKMLKKVIEIMKGQGYIGNYEIILDGKGGIISVELSGRLNKCGVIKPRFSVTKNGYEKFEKRYLPAKDFGQLIVSTQKGVMMHTEAIEQGLGGKLIAYVY